MISRLLFSSLFALIFGIASSSVQADPFPAPYNTETAESAPMSAEKAARTATLPPGFKLEVFASEPEIQQPISICFDNAGQLWVAECYTFAERPLRWDLELQDRILVLKDSDGDGKSDSRTVFWDEGKKLTSIAHGNGGVWALAAPQLLFIPDEDGDLVPDREPIVMLDGFEAETIGHNIANGLKWGPDGWLYGRHGITATSQVGAPGTPKSERTELNCSIWRFHPETKQFEVFCHGGTNPWGLDWDANGQLFYTNTVIGHLWHGIPGGYYTRMFGAHLNQQVYELIPHTADHYHWDTGSEKWNDNKKGLTSRTSELGGGHAHMGCLIYEGGVWPEAFRGKLFTCNLHGRRVNMDILEREGVGYVAHHGKDFLMMEDPWFRGLDLVTGPDGQVWMNDWSDTGECHDNDAIHRTSGRIYRIVYDGPGKGTPTPERAEWLTARAGAEFGKEAIEALITSDEEARQAMGVRFLVEDFSDDPKTWETLNQLAEAAETPGLVRLELASSLQRLPHEERFPIATGLANHAGDADDRQQPLMIWYGIADAVPEYPEKAIALATSSQLPTLTRLISRRLCEDIESNPEAVDSLLTSAAQSGNQDVISGMSAALEGWSKAPQPKSWAVVSAEFESTMSAEIRELSVLFGDGRARDELLAIAKNTEADPNARRAALTNLLRQPSKDLLPLLQTWLNDKVISREAVRGLASFDAPGVSTRVINHWKRNPSNRSAAIDTLVSRASFAADLLTAIKNDQLSRDAISPFQARQIQSLGDEKLNHRLRDVWGDIRETPEAKKKEIAEWKALLTAEVIESADPVKGKTAFAQACATCHKLYGEGGAFGPDLTGSDRHNLDYLLGNIVNPNDVVPADYRLTIFTLKDGRVISGVVPEENEQTVVIQSAAEAVAISLKDIEKRETMPVSLMPEGLLKAIGKDAVKDLVAYLMSKNAL